MSKAVPIVLFIYNRPLHTKRTMEALVKNKECIESTFYVFSDGPRSESEVDSVLQSRLVIDEYRHLFANVKMKMRDKNVGLANSIIDGINKVFQEEKEEEVIVLEDDLIVSRYFLHNMNRLLREFKSEDSISSVSAYTYAIGRTILDKLESDFFLLQRPGSWGWGTWKSKWLAIDWNDSGYEILRKDSNMQKAFNSHGSDLTPMLVKQQMGVNDSWAIRWAFHHFKNNLNCVFCRYSMVKNIGLDGSGTHSSKTGINDDLFSDEFKIQGSSNIKPKFNDYIRKELKSIYDVSVIRKTINFIKYGISPF